VPEGILAARGREGKKRAFIRGREGSLRRANLRDGEGRKKGPGKETFSSS